MSILSFFKIVAIPLLKIIPSKYLTIKKYCFLVLFTLAYLANNYLHAINTSPISSVKNYSTLFDLAKSYVNQNNWAQALECYLEASAIEPLQPEPLLEIAQHYSTTHEHSLCYLFARRAAELSLTNNDILNNLLSDSAWHIGDYHLGHQATLNALKISPFDEQLLKNLVLYKKQESVETKLSEKIVQLLFRNPGIGGIENHVIIFNKMLTKHGFFTQVLTSTYSSLVVNAINKQQAEYSQPCATYIHSGYEPLPADIIEQSPTIIICNWINELSAAIKVRSIMPAKVIYLHHGPYNHFLTQAINDLNQIDGIVTVDPFMAQQLEKTHKKGQLNVKNIATVPPFFDAHKFTSFVPQRSKAAFLGEDFGLTIPDEQPIITMIANMVHYKNHSLLIEAIDILHNQRHKKFHVLLAGNGDDLEHHKTTIAHLKLNNIVHFLGQTLNTAELLYHTNIHVLASSFEGFPIVQMEAGLMKKPFVGSNSTSIISYVQQGINGFTFENNNAEDLANKLELLLDDPERCKTMGENAYQYTLANFVPEVTFKKWQEFLATI